MILTKNNQSIFLCDKRVLCDWVKYIAALLIVNGHVFLFPKPDSPFSPFMNMGACSVSVFFFFSGYGLMTRYIISGNAYLKGFFKRRIIKILLPLLTAYAITLPVYALLRGPVDWRTFWNTLLWGGPYLRYSWYVTEIVVLYGVFFFIMRIKGRVDAKRVIITIIVLLLIGLLIVTKQPNWYVISTPAFILGVWFQAYEEKLSILLSQNFMLAASCLVWFFTWQWRLVGQNIFSAYKWEYLSYYICNIAFVCMIAGLLCRMKIRLPNSRVIKSSYEVYLMQNCIFIMLSALSVPFIGYWLLSIVSAIFVGYMVHCLNGKLYSI